MSVSITTIQPSDSLAASRITLNSNFSALKSGIDSVQLLLDPATSILQNVKSATINDSAVSFSTTIFQVGKGSILAGNVTLGSIGLATSISVKGTGGMTIDTGSLTLTLGNLSLSSSSSLASFGGHMTLANELRLPGAADAFSNTIGLTQTATTSIVVASKKYIVIKNDGATAGVYQGLTASLNAGTNGQVLEIFHALGASGFPVTIATTNFTGLTGGIKMTQSNDTIKCVYDGSTWSLWSWSAASFARTTGLTVSSITFTTT